MRKSYSRIKRTDNNPEELGNNEYFAEKRERETSFQNYEQKSNQQGIQIFETSFSRMPQRE